MINTILRNAKAEIGYTEGAKNDNKYAKIAGHANNQPWCMTFVRAMFCASEAAGYIMNTASTQTLEAWAIKNGLTVPVEQTQRGDVVIYSFSGKHADHVGIAYMPYDAEKQEVATIEGNTSNGEAKGKAAAKEINGDGVYARHRSTKFVRTVVRPKW